MREVATKDAGAETTNKRTKARFIERAPGDHSLRGVFVANERPQMNLVSMYPMIVCGRSLRGLRAAEGL